MENPNELFRIEPSPEPDLHKYNTCKDCKHCQRWQCNSKVFHYCGVRKSKRTQNGLLKIKCKDKACLLFESFN